MGTHDAFGMSLAYLGVHLLTSSDPLKHLVLSPCAMFQLKSNCQSFSTLWSQGCLALMLKSIFSGHYISDVPARLGLKAAALARPEAALAF
jgi:hypothetical protein